MSAERSWVHGLFWPKRIGAGDYRFCRLCFPELEEQPSVEQVKPVSAKPSLQGMRAKQRHGLVGGAWCTCSSTPIFWTRNGKVYLGAEVFLETLVKTLPVATCQIIRSSSLRCAQDVIALEDLLHILLAWLPRQTWHTATIPAASSPAVHAVAGGLLPKPEAGKRAMFLCSLQGWRGQRRKRRRVQGKRDFHQISSGQVHV